MGSPGKGPSESPGAVWNYTSTNLYKCPYLTHVSITPLGDSILTPLSTEARSPKSECLVSSAQADGGRTES
jgi:hypothetical protein